MSPPFSHVTRFVLWNRSGKIVQMGTLIGGVAGLDSIDVKIPLLLV